jgi:hypothetical protein
VDSRCPVCTRHTLVDNVCRTDTDVCCELCEKCGKVEVTGEAPSCEHCAPVYEVATMAATYYSGRSLRRAWEAHCYLDATGYRDALLVVPEAMALDRDGLSDRELDCIAGWDSYESGGHWHEGKFVGGLYTPIHTCIAPSDAELARRAQQIARAA